VTENQNENKKCLMMHNIDPMFNIRNAFFFQADAPSIICQLERFGIFDLTLLKKISETFAFGRFPGIYCIYQARTIYDPQAKRGPRKLLIEPANPAFILLLSLIKLPLNVYISTLALRYLQKQDRF
jgi:hypothetical protein